MTPNKATVPLAAGTNRTHLKTCSRLITAPHLASDQFVALVGKASPSSKPQLNR